MLPRQVNLANIEKYLIYIESDIQTNNYCRFYDINIISESFCCDLLNISFGLDLENTNLFKRNQKAIDLVDKKRGIAIQITSEKSLTKIKETFEQYIDAGLDKIYPNLYIVTLVKYSPSTSEYIYKNNVFNIKSKVLDYRDYINILSNKYDNKKLIEIVQFLESELEISREQEIEQHVEELRFDTEHTIKDAIVGNRLYPYNVKTCPELPVIEKIEETLKYQYYCVISGESGCGKSISAYQVAYKYYEKGWKVYIFLNNNIFDYKIFSKFNDKTLLIIDDAQVLKNFQIERIISNVNVNIRVIITITEEIVVQDDSVAYITNQDSIKKIAKEYLKRKNELYPILREIDKDIDDRYMKDTIEERIQIASKQKTPWLFNFVLRGGWNRAKTDFKRIKERNEAHKLLIILSFLQLFYTDKPISKLELLKKCEIWDKDYEWFEDNLQYLVKNKIIIEEYNKYRCAHIRYADFFTYIFIENSDKDELECILKFLKEIILDENYSLQGISWVLHNVKLYGKGCYLRNNLINDEELQKIVNRCFSCEESLNIRNALFVIDELDQYNEKILTIIEKEKYLKRIAYWIENVDKNTGYALSGIINDYFINKHLNIRLLFSYIKIDRLVERINHCHHKAIWHISNLLERLLYAINNKQINKQIISKINMKALAEKINADFKDMYLEEIVDIIGVINLYYDEEEAIKLYEATKNAIKYYFEKNALRAFENIENNFLWMFLGYSFSSNKQPKEKYQRIAKEILSFIDINKLAFQISNTNLHDMRRYANFLDWINIVDIEITKKIVKLIDYDLLDETMKKYFKKPPYELKLFIYSIGTSKEKKFFDWMDKNIEKIEIAEPMISVVFPKVVERCIECSYEVNIFGHNDSFDGALSMIIALSEYDEELCLKVLELSINKIIQKMSDLRYIIDFTKEEMTYNFFNYIRKNYQEIFLKIINSLDVEKVKQNIKENYNKIINDNDKVKKKMLKEFERILNIYKLNSELKDFCNILLSK